MKFFTKFFALITMSFLISCSEDDMGQFSSVNDITASSSPEGGITVQFTINSIEGASDLSLAIVKSAQSNGFTTDDFIALERSSITDISPSDINVTVNINSDQLDSDGEPLVAGTAYSILIYSAAINYLSAPSTAFTYSIEQFEKVSDLKVNEELSGAQLSRIAVSFTTNSSKNVEEFWIVISKTKPIYELTTNYILSLNQSQYTSVATSPDNMYALDINQSQLDSDGHRLVDGSFYKVHVFGKGSDQPIKSSSTKKFKQIESFNNVTDLWIHDIGNTGNASDLRVIFDVNASRGINNFNVLLTKSSVISNLTLDKAKTLSTNQSTVVEANGDNTFTVDLSADQLDSDGQTLVFDERYNIHIYNDDLGILSAVTESILFSENGIMTGSYAGLFNDNLFQNIPYSLEITMNENGEYTGPVFISAVFTSSWGGETDGDTKFIIENNKITYWEYNQDLPTYKGGCPGLYTGTSGSIGNDFSIRIEFTGNDCDGYHEDGVITLDRDWRR